MKSSFTAPHFSCSNEREGEGQSCFGCNGSLKQYSGLRKNRDMIGERKTYTRHSAVVKKLSGYPDEQVYANYH